MRDRTQRHHHEEREPHERRQGRHRHGGEEDWHGGGRFGNPGGRARRGELRYMILDTLRDGPRHGYEIIKAFEERTRGQYAPSPGTVYPTLQYLEELSHVRAEQEGERRVYHLTEAGRTELNLHTEEVNAFWTHFAGAKPSAVSQHEIGFLQDELEALTRTVSRGLRAALDQENPETILRVRLAVEQCRNEVRRILTEPNNDARSEKF